MAPYETHARKWQNMTWTNVYEPGSAYRILPRSATGTESYNGRSDHEVGVKTYRDTLQEYRMHPEAKSTGPDESRATGKRLGCSRANRSASPTSRTSVRSPTS